MISKRDIATLVFSATSIVLAVALVRPTLNYVTFFTAIERFDLALLDVSPSIRESNATISFIFAIINNSSYSGFKLKWLTSILYYEVNDTCRELLSRDKPFAEPTLIGPHSNITLKYLNIDLNVKTERTNRFIEFFKQVGGNVTWVLKCTALIDTNTFLGDKRISLEHASFYSHL